MCDIVARKMLDIVESCDLRDRDIERSSARSDCDDMWGHFSYVLKRRPEVDRGMRASGLKPLASVKSNMELLYQEHQRNVRPASKK